jgi:NitT/TauT family transport system permease protein
VPSYVFPAPSEIFKALFAGFAEPIFSRSGYYMHITTTAIEALASFVIGSLLGVVAGALIIQFSLLRRIVLPYFIGLQSVPKVALAPLFVVWFGLGISSKIVLGVLLTFFPLMINTAAGLASVERDRLELMQSLKASGWKTFRLVKLPSALPFIFAGLEMAAAYAVLGAVVGEFVGGTSGLGVLILNRNAVLDVAGSLAALIILALMGVGLQRAVAAVRARVLFWAPSQDTLADRV